MSELLRRLWKPNRYKVEITVFNANGNPIYKMNVLAIGRTKWGAMADAEKKLEMKATRAWKA